MRSLRNAKFFIALFALAFAFGFATPSMVRAAESTTGLITGVVVDATGAPVAGAKIIAASPSGRNTAVTDRAGRFVILGLAPDSYTVSVEAPKYQVAVQPGTSVLPGQTTRLAFRLEAQPRTIGKVTATNEAFSPGSTTDAFTVSGAKARAQSPTTSAAGLANYTQGTVQGAIANVPGVDLDPFANAILRGGKVGDAVFDYASVPIPQGLIAEPGGNVAGAQLPTTGIASTSVTLAGFSSEGDNALGGVINQIPAIGTYPGKATLELANGIGTQMQFSSFELLGATPDLKWRYALASTFGNDYFSYGDGHTFYPSEAATYGIALQSRSQYSIASNVHYRLNDKDDVSLLGLVGQATYNQYATPYLGQTVGALDGTDANGNPVTYPGATNPNAPVTFAAGVRGSYDVLKAEWLHTGATLLSRVQIYQSQYGSSNGGPFWDENGYPDGAISLSATQNQRQNGINYDGDGVFGQHRIRFGAEYRINTSFLDQIVPTADEFITSRPTVDSYLAYLGDTWSASDRLTLSATARLTAAHFKPSDGFAYDVGALDPHFGTSYRLGRNVALRATFDHTTVAPAPLEADRTDSTNVDNNGNPAPFVSLAAQTSNDFTYSFESTGPTKLRLTYYQSFEKNLIDVLPYNFRSALAAGINPGGVGVPSNIGDLRANGLELYVNNGGFTFNGNLVRAYSSSASQFAYNGLNAPAVAANHLFPVNYVPDLSAQISYQFSADHHRLRITPSLSYQTGYPYGNGKKIYIFGADDKPIQVPNDNFYNPGYNYYFLRDPSEPFNAVTNPYIGNLGTNEGNDPNTLRSTPQMLVNLHVEKDLGRRLTAIFDVANLLGNFSPTAYQGNPYLIGPPGYTGGNALYNAAYQNAAGFDQPYTLGNGVPTNNGVNAIVPWTYGRDGYVTQSYPMGRTFGLRLRYSM
jgi:hypothetical protein